MALKSFSKNLVQKHTSYQRVACDNCNQHVTAVVWTLTAVTSLNAHLGHYCEAVQRSMVGCFVNKELKII
jgi:hypothetical protein